MNLIRMVIGLFGLTISGYLRRLRRFGKVLVMLRGGLFGSFVTKFCPALISRIWSFFLMTLFVCLILGVLIDVNLIMIGTLG